MTTDTHTHSDTAPGNLGVDWESYAVDLARDVTSARSRWRGPVASVPRHRFVPRWWAQDSGTGSWTPRHGPASTGRWLATAYTNQTVVTSVAGQHADHADSPLVGLPTSSSTRPSLLVRMFQYAHIGDDDTVFTIGTGPGYGTALLCRRLGDHQVTSVDIDPYLTEAARERLAGVDLHPRLVTLDATTQELPGTADRMVSTVGVRPIPPGWLAALRTGGRLVTTIAGTSLLVTAEKTPDGGAAGRVEWEPAAFMRARGTPGAYPPGADRRLADAHHLEGEDVDTSPYPVVDVGASWDLISMLTLTAPDIESAYHEDGGQPTAVLAHADGSWARATGYGHSRTIIHQGGPRRLWDLVEEIRALVSSTGDFPVRGARVDIGPDGTTTISRGHWSTVL